MILPFTDTLPVAVRMAHLGTAGRAYWMTLDAAGRWRREY